MKISHPYYLWEDYKNGMYNEICVHNHKECKKLVEKIMSDRDIFVSTGMNIVREWVYASEENLTNKSINRRAWVGQAVCSYLYLIPESETKIIWSNMPQEIKDFSNKSADIVINFFENRDIDKINLRLL